MRKIALLSVICFVVIILFITGFSRPVHAVDELTPEQAQQIAQEAFVYAYPMLETYKTMLVTLDKLSPKFWAPLNQLYYRSTLSGPAYTTVVLTNNDSLYYRGWLDLRSEPVVLSVPALPKERFYTIQLADLYTHNFAYVGTRATGNGAGHYLIAGPNWNGTKPTGIDAVIRSDSNFVFVLGRMTVYGPDDLPNARALQLQNKVEPLSAFLGQPLPRLPLPPYPSHRLIFWLAARWFEPIGPGRPGASDALGLPEEELSAAGFITYLNFMLGQVRLYPYEQDMMARFTRIGIGPNRPFSASALKPEIRKAIEAGVVAGYEQIRDYFPHLADESRNGWNLFYTLFGTPEQMRGKYLRRAAAAMYGLYGNSFEEAYYPFTITDGTGQSLDASKRSYMMKFRKEDLPTVKGFWSLTMYYWPQEFLVSNPINRYSIGDRTPGVKYGEDGSLTIYLSFLSPGEDLESNWLPAPNGPFFLLWRLYAYAPKQPDQKWAPPPVTVMPHKLDFRTFRAP